MALAPVAAAEVEHQTQRDFALLDTGTTPAPKHANAFGSLGFGNYGGVGAIELDAKYDLPLGDRAAVVASASYLLPTGSASGLSFNQFEGGAKYQVGSFGVSGLGNTVGLALTYRDISVGYFGTAVPIASSLGAGVRWATTYRTGNDAVTFNLGIGFSEHVSPDYPYGLGWTHSFGKARVALEWSDAISGWSTSQLGTSAWMDLGGKGGAESRTSLGLGGVFGLGGGSTWQINLMGQWRG